MKTVGLICVAFLVSCYASVRAAEQQFTTQAVRGDQLVLPAFVRVDRPFNRGWTYHLEGSGTSRTIDLPHDYQFEQPWTQKGGGARGFKAPGTRAVYTNCFDYDSAWDGKRVYLEFEAIMSSGEVEVNGKKVGECDYGYVGCTLDVTDKLVKDKPNVVKVTCTTGAQKGSRWYTGGGLIRPVHLIVKSPVSIVEDGVFVRTEGEQVKVQVQLDGYRGLGRKNELKIEATIKDADGAVVGSGETVAPWSKLRHQLVELAPIAVKAPKLWDITSPNLYTCEVKLVLNGAEIDQASDHFGFRTVEFSKDFGFKLNGRKVWLVGMANHHDLGALGAAAFDDGIRRMMRTIKSFGYNALRCSHNPYSKGFYRIADEEGLLVVDELYDKWGFAGRNWWIGSKPQRETWPVHMKRWMMRDRNHPSVILWSLGNEFQMNEDICGYDTDDWGITTYRMMREYARRYDPTRLTTVAMFPARAGAVGKNDPKDLYETYDPPELATVTDVSSFNYQPHAYKGYLERAPWMTVFQSEATTSEGLKAMNLMDREKMVGLCYWGAIEYWGESNKWPKKGWNYSFFSHTFEPFPRAWLIQSGAEPDKPLVHLGIVEKGGEMTNWNEQKSGQERIRENWTRTPGEKVTVVVYSNQDEVELFLNGKSLGKKSVPHGATESANTARYTDVVWEPGELKAVAGSVSHTIRSAGPVDHLKVMVDYEGDELIYARIVGVDAEGRENLAATGKVQVTVSGGGTLYALDNGDHYTDELFASDISAKDLHDGTLQVIVRKTPGATAPVKIKAELWLFPVFKRLGLKGTFFLNGRRQDNPDEVVAFGAVHAGPRETVVPFEPGERWWGAANAFAPKMPFTEATCLTIDLTRENYGNQSASFLVSDQGRTIWSEEQACFVISGGVIRVTGPKEVAVVREGTTLAEGYRSAMKRHFPPSGRSPDALFVLAPQLNTWIELTYHQNQRGILAYARTMLEKGVPPGVLMIDDTWQAGYGDWRFEPSRFPDPKGMMDELHRLGYKVMLWMCPFVGMDLPAFRRIAWGQNPDDVRGYPTKGGFLTELRNDNPKCCRWWNGYSAFLDFSHPNANAWFAETLDGLVRDYGADGFKLDGGTLEEFELRTRRAKDPTATSGTLNQGYAAYALMYPFCEIRNLWRHQQMPVVVRLCDKKHEWRALRKLLPEMIGAGLLGHPFICPDMVGGGEWSAFIPGSRFEQELFIRSAQIHALCPMMQISASPWRVLDAEHQKIFSDILTLRQRFTPRFAALVEQAGRDGEPVLRALEYNYPHQGYASVMDQFMMGEDLLVAPQVYPRAESRLVVLPPGRWRGDDGKIVEGPAEITVPTPLVRIPYFERISPSASSRGGAISSPASPSSHSVASHNLWPCLPLGVES